MQTGERRDSLLRHPPSGAALAAGFSPPPHIHHNEDEAFYILSGRIEAQLAPIVHQ